MSRPRSWTRSTWCVPSGRGDYRSMSPRTGSPSGGSSRARVSRSRPGARSGRRRTCAEPPTSSAYPCASRSPPAAMTAAARLRLNDASDIDGAIDRLGQRPGEPLLVETELAFGAEVSIIVARGAVGRIATFPLACNRHDEGILVESLAPASLDPEIAERAIAIGERLAVMMGVTGTLTVELFLMPDQRLSSTSSPRGSITAATGRSKVPRPPSSSSTSAPSAGSTWARRMPSPRPRSSICSARVLPARPISTPSASPGRWPTRRSTSISTTSARCSSDGRWAT